MQALESSAHQSLDTYNVGSYMVRQCLIKQYYPVISNNILKFLESLIIYYRGIDRVMQAITVSS